MKRSASVRFDYVLATGEREDAARTLRSAGATVTSWTAAAGRTYAALDVAAQATPATIALVTAGRLDMPALVVLRVSPVATEYLASLAVALGGPGRPQGVLAARADATGVVVELAPQITALSVVVALIDVELERRGGRAIEPLLPLDDATLAAFAGDVLQEPDLVASRLIETHLEPLLAAAGGRRV